MDKKYRLTENTLHIKSSLVRQIVALRDIYNPYYFVKEGTLGGFIESENNLSHRGECWVFPKSIVYENARIYEYATIRENVQVRGSATIRGHATVLGATIISGKSIVQDNCLISGSSMVTDLSKIFSNAKIHDVFCKGIVKAGKNAMLTSEEDYITIGPIGSRNDYTTFYKSVDGDIWVSCGCFNGSIEDFEETVKFRHDDTAYAKDYYAAINMAKTHILHAS